MANDRVVMLTTADNPYDPYNKWDEWYAFDTQKGYNSCAYLARITRTTDGVSDEENDAEIERAIDDICRLNLTCNYQKNVYLDGVLQKNTPPGGPEHN